MKEASRCICCKNFYEKGMGNQTKIFHCPSCRIVISNLSKKITYLRNKCKRLLIEKYGSSSGQIRIPVERIKKAGLWKDKPLVQTHNAKVKCDNCERVINTRGLVWVKGKMVCGRCKVKRGWLT